MTRFFLVLGTLAVFAASANADSTYTLLITYWGKVSSATPGLTKQQCDTQKSAVTVVVTFSSSGAQDNPITTVDPNAASSAECLQSPP